MRVLVTGATGFVGGHLCAALLQAGHQVTAAVRLEGVIRPKIGIREIGLGDFGPESNWRKALVDVDVVMHVAARAHVLRETADDPEAAYRRVNVEATAALATQAAASGARRFIFLSSVKAGAEQTHSRIPLRVDMTPQPEGAYGRTKLLAEKNLVELGEKTGMETVILRSPLIYGPGIKGNLLSLFNAVDKGLPLPLRWVDNRRDLLFVGNLIAAMMHAMGIPAQQCGPYYVCDGEAISVAELIRRIAHALDRPARLLPVPPIFLRLVGAMSGRSETIKRLTGSLLIDGDTFCQRVNWMPPYTMKEGLAQTAAWYKSRGSTDWAGETDRAE
jgi:nucleoside-diphosphate-sugar epimerase